VDYRRAPEHRFPAAVEDAWVATCWAASQTPKVAVGGDSAGGNLAAVMALRARDAGLPLALQVLVNPVLDHNFSTPSYSAHAEGKGLTRAAIHWYWAHYLGAQDGSHPEASPLRAASLEGVAPALIVVSEYDPLRDEAVSFAERLRKAGIEVRLSMYEGMIHGFFRMAAVIDRTNDLLDECALALQAAFAPSRRAV
jgi:acetyl esterase